MRSIVEVYPSLRARASQSAGALAMAVLATLLIFAPDAARAAASSGTIIGSVSTTGTAGASAAASNLSSFSAPAGKNSTANISTGNALSLVAGNTIAWNGSTSYLFGADYPWWNYGTDFGTGAWGKFTSWSSINTDFANMSAQGVHVARWFVFADCRYSPDFNADGTVSGLDSYVLSDVDQALQIAAANHVYLLLTVLDNSAWAAASDSSGIQTGGHAAIVTDAATQQSYLDNALKPLLEHIAASPYASEVMGYDIVNEPEGQMSGYWGGSNLSPSAVQTFVQRCAVYIHLYGGVAYATVGSATPYYVSAWENLGLDFYEIHYYPWMDFSGAAGSGLPTYASLNLDRPCIVGEYASADGSYNTTDTAALSAEWYLDTIYNDGYAGGLAWSYNAGDSASDWSSFQPVFTAWGQGHSTVVGPN